MNSPLPHAFAERAAQIAGPPVRLLARGGGWTVFRLRANDRARVVNLEGLQPGELFVLSRDGSAEAALPALVGLGPAPTPAVGDGEGAGMVLAALSAERAAMADFSGFSLFTTEAAAGDVFPLQAAADVLCLLRAPGGPMAPDAQDTPTDLRVEIERAAGAEAQPPAPLAPPKLDLRVRAASAEAFTVRAGDYIQIIDVEGRQCSDFLAFEAVALSEGREAGLDATTTRTLMGAAYPAPGLHGKFFNQDQQALVEVIRDTVGRHDTFMLACSAKYYDDMGYPGHANCTDNFNRALAPYGVAPKKGWPAINFFYNTILNADQSIGLDEPWSRPGDYVLLRALTDIVCAASSCSDDIDPANGWIPTDIHVRVYDAAADFSKGLAHRMTPDAEPRLSRESGFYPRIAALTRNFQEYRGFWLPTCFAGSGPIDEYWACRERGGGDGPVAPAQVRGDRPRCRAADATRRHPQHPQAGRGPGGLYRHVLSARRHDRRRHRVPPGREQLPLDLRRRLFGRVAARDGGRARLEGLGPLVHRPAAQHRRPGPAFAGYPGRGARHPAAQPSIQELKWFRFTVGKLAGVPVVVSRTGYTGELGYEVWCHPGQAVAVWDAVWAAGRPHGLTPMGLTALDMVRIEAGLVFAGYDFSDQTDPFEAGIGFTVPADKPDDYVGKAALERRRAHPQHQLVGLDIASTEGVHHGDPVYQGRAQIGVVTSAAKSPLLRKTIALARLDVASAALGTRVEIGKLDGLQKRIAAEVVGFPHYDPQKTRVRA